MRSLISLMLLLCSFYVFSQDYEKYNIEINEGETIQTILPSQEVYINSATKIGGKTRVYFPITLPKNTIRWFYVITTTKGAGEGEALNILGQLAATTLSGGTSLAVSAGTKMLSVPSGSGGVVDSYLLNRQNLDVFTSKSDNWGTSLYYDVEGTRKNFKSGLVMITLPREGNNYIGIKNPSSSVGVNVKIQAIAIIKENAEWERDIAGKGSFKDALNDLLQSVLDATYPQYNKNLLNEIKDCSLNKIIKEQAPVNFTLMNASEKSAYIYNKSEECVSEFKQSAENKDVNKSKIYGDLGLSYLEKNDLEKAYNNFIKALEINPKNGEVRSNLGFLHLIKGESDLATEQYIEAIDIFNTDPFHGQENLIKAYRRIENYLKSDLRKIEVALKNQANDFISIQEMLFKEIKK